MCPDCQSLKFTGKVRGVGKEWVDRVFEANPGMNEVYPGESRYALDAFLIYAGHGEWFDLLHYPINRETFAYGGDAEERNGFLITAACTGCGACAPVCPEGCIAGGEGLIHVVDSESCTDVYKRQSMKRAAVTWLSMASSIMASSMASTVTPSSRT